MRRTPLSLALLGLMLACTGASGQARPRVFTHADSLRGSTTSPFRTWWDVTFYDLNVAVHPADSSISGWNRITYRVVQPAREMQIDLMQPLEVDSIVQDRKALTWRRDGGAFFVTLEATQRTGDRNMVTVFYHGKPKHLPNDGFNWAKDSLGRPWFITVDQGVGSSIWWPLKDSWADEPDSARISVTVPAPLVQVSPGRLRFTDQDSHGETTYTSFVANPINAYAINITAGAYAHYQQVYQGERGPLTMDFYPLDYHLNAAKRQFPQAMSMMKCFEHWFGPYPWYEDGYKLIEAPNTGMEHQTAVTYGNNYANGYRGRDVSGTGLGLGWDYIIVHESSHEWFGNNITARDQRDMWIQEGFASYAEGLYTECLFGKDAGEEYIVGNRRSIRNDAPIELPEHGVGASGSGDQYAKGSAMLHTIRQLVGDDERWRGILRGLNKTFWHQTVDGSQIEQYITRQSGIDLSKVFDQYLRTTMVPTLEYRLAGSVVSYRWTDVVPGFSMPVRVWTGGTGWRIIRPTENWNNAGLRGVAPGEFRVDRNYYVRVKDSSSTDP